MVEAINLVMRSEVSCWLVSMWKCQTFEHTRLDTRQVFMLPDVCAAATTAMCRGGTNSCSRQHKNCCTGILPAVMYHCCRQFSGVAVLSAYVKNILPSQQGLHRRLATAWSSLWDVGMSVMCRFRLCVYAGAEYCQALLRGLPRDLPHL